MFSDHNSALAEILKTSGSLSSEDYDTVVAEHERTGKSIAQSAIDLDFVTQKVLLEMVAAYMDWPFCDSPPDDIDPALADKLEGRLARMYGVVPFQERGMELQLLAVDPLNASIIEDLAFTLDRDITLVVADPALVNALIAQVYGVDSASVEQALSELAQLAYLDGQSNDLESLADEAPVIQFVGLVLEQAIRDMASDIHFEPFVDVFQIRYRVDGTLYEMAPSPVGLALPVISRIKVLANLNIAEKRIPQDGRIRMTLGGRPIDLRVSTLPTQYGESVVLRVLDKTVVNLELSSLGMPSPVLNSTQEVIKRPNGVFVVTGPTGSGKTTTLYSCLKILNKDETKILTAEDPVEYEIDGIVQLAVNPGIGLSFAHALRSFLRQDPDILMVGEIRDLETARIAVQAAQTGHLVLTTLHTKDAPGAVTRLLDMGMEPYLIASSLEAVLAQRLVRTLCPHCKKSYWPDDSILDQLYPETVCQEKVFYRSVGCRACHQIGYQGRKGLFEFMNIEDSLRELILARASGLSLKRRAMDLGMNSLRQSGIEAVEEGITTVEEVLNYT
jgi:type IV pilus assembly protein PilB